MKIILASASAYRAELLARLRLPFEQRPTHVDESGPEDEPPVERARRLSLLKADAMRAEEPNALIIASDQVACVDGYILDKPGNHERAYQQLTRMSGQVVDFHTGLVVLAPRAPKQQVAVQHYQVKMRNLDDADINTYLEQEQPWNCAASFKSEALGMALFEWMRGDDPTSLIGLPLITLTDMLNRLGVNPLRNP